MKYRIKNNLKIQKRNTINEYIREQLNEHHQIFIQGTSGSGKTYAIYSFIQEYYDNQYIYIKLDKTDNNIDLFKQHFKEAFTQASLNDHTQIFNKPYVCVIDQLEVIDNEEVLEHIHSFIENIPDNLKLMILSSKPLQKCLYSLIYYNQLTIIKKCPLFYDKKEILKLFKKIHPKHINPNIIYNQTKGWPILVHYFILHNYQFTGEDYILKSFFDNLNFTPTQLYLLKIISLAPYISKNILKTLSLESLNEDLNYLMNIMLISEENEQLSLIPIYKLYIQDKYKNEKEDILKTVYPYYEKHNYIDDLLYCFQYIHKDKKKDYIKNNHLIISDRHLLQLDDDTLSTLYLKGRKAFYSSDDNTYKNIITELKTYEQTDEVKEEFINLMLLSSQYKLNTILKYKNKNIHFHSFSGGYPSYINGKHDLSFFYDSLYKNQKTTQEYQSILTKQEQISLKLGEIEYLFNINQIQKCIEEIEYFLTYKKEELSYEASAVLSSLLFKIYYVHGLKDNSIQFYKDYRNRISTQRNNILLEENMKLHDIYVNCLLNEKEKVNDWYDSQNIEEDVRYDNYYRIYIIARINYLMERYDKAYYYFTKLESFFRKEKRTIYLSECLFASASCLLALNNETRALHRVTEAFMIAGSYRFIFLFITYGHYGLEIMKTYRKLMQNDSDTKQSYEYGTISKSYDKYLKTIIKQCEKIIKLYPTKEKMNYEKLTIKETAVLKCIIKGYTNNDISEELVISLPTVKTHISNIFSKLGVKNRTQAIAYAKNNNLFDK